MNHEWYLYRFAASVNLDDVQVCMVLAVFALESLHGEAQTMLDASYAFEDDKNVCLVDASTGVGKDLNRLFAGFLRRELSASDFQVERCEDAEAAAACS